ncbi:hypothetical protein LJR220_003331 [Bradyrhizobium sp. LjRoot220]|uniref:hypothetical protein n=1 Tax=Bradyrhizobium sp. LjRoot220 TaxID=3342284 RepID=UPI003ED0F87B
MPTIIDSLVVELGLDPKKFTAGQRQALDEAKKLENQQLASAKNIEHASSRAGEAIGSVRTEALRLFGALGGSAAVIALATKITTADAAVGRLSRNLNMSTETISKWQGVARIFGGDAATMAQTFTTISDAVEGFKIGKISPLIADFRALSTAGGTIIDVNKGVDQTLLDISANLKKIHDTDPARAGLMGRIIGLDPGLYDLLVKGPGATQQMLDKVKSLGITTKAAAENAGELAKAWNSVGLAIEGAARPTTTILGPALADALNAAAKDISGNRSYVGLSKIRETGLSGFWETLKQGLPWTSASKPSAATPAGGAFTSQLEKEQFIRAEAARRGINPNVAMQVARSEGFTTFVGDNGTSFGSYQLHVTPGGKGRAVGDQFRAATGLDPSDPKNERAGIQFALDDVRRNGWTAYHGAKRVGLDKWSGIDRNGGSTSTTEVNINGPITVTPPANASPEDFASRFSAAIARQSFAQQAAGGQQ